MLNGNQRQVISTIKSYNSETFGESLISLAMAYCAPMAPVSVPNYSMFFIQNIMTKVTDLACELNELHILDVRTIEAMAKDAWIYRQLAAVSPRENPVPGTEGWSSEQYQALRALQELFQLEFGSAA